MFFYKILHIKSSLGVPRRTHPPAHVRAWFGLSQAELALDLGITSAMLSSLEGGSRALSAAVRPALLPLLPHLPTAPEPAPAPTAALPAGTAPPEAADLDLRRRQCQQRAAHLLALADQAQVARHWQAALLATDATEAAAAPEANAQARATWRTSRLHRHARPLPAAAATQHRLLLARAAGLLAEAAALTEAAALAFGAPATKATN
ncbi:helix-turn-helix transcriptional regulator [Hymenobacter sp. H14-R3]|uniref:helix-turn-helix domain-containing protein n=1 Tax=Hymenobacter sp. H14-R3 TaxID=3046308 RepID=UPI0024B882D2|nr:helix-turn-helix transcriptional regulator [Hymenobacter sp. H14-R3]MDJ0366559.1 helix-turn-helix transcriptional regulator [Hymenobacter sp. H14-R3]